MWQKQTIDNRVLTFKKKKTFNKSNLCEKTITDNRLSKVG